MTTQPAPIPNDNEPVWDILIRRMHDRDAFGREKYGTPLQVDNGRIDEEDILDELLDAAVYTLKAKLQRQKREERIREEIAGKILGLANAGRQVLRATGANDPILEAKLDGLEEAAAMALGKQ